MNYIKKHHKREKQPFNKNILLYIPLAIAFIAILLFNQCNGENFRPYIKAYSKQNDIPYFITANIIQVESTYNKYAVSHKKAIGLGQVTTIGLLQYFKLTRQYKRKIEIADILMLFTAKRNIQVMTRYYRWAYETHDGNIYKALHTYNMGIRNTWNGRFNVEYVHKITGVKSDVIRKALYPIHRLAYHNIFKRGE